MALSPQYYTNQKERFSIFYCIVSVKEKMLYVKGRQED
jgi:hypothetical protein